MTFSLPPNYLLLPVEIIVDAYRPDKRHGELFLSLVSLLALAWQNSYEKTPKLREEDLYNSVNGDGTQRDGYLHLSRRQYFTQKREMQLLGWLRSSQPAPGFVQFTFCRTVSTDKNKVSAENRTPSAENPDLRGGEKESDSNLNTDSPLPPQADASAENRTSLPSTVQILSQTELLFGATHRVHSKDIEDRDPLQALAWCAYAYKSRLTGAAGIVRNRLRDCVPASEWAKEQWREILPTPFLEVLGLVEYTCDECQATFKRMIDLHTHQSTHPRRFSCSRCEQTFAAESDLDTHVDEAHTSRTVTADDSVRQAIRDGSTMTPEQAWQSVLGQLQMEMPRASFETWVRDTRAVRYDRNGGTLTIGARNAYAREWLESRLSSTVSRLLIGILNTSVCVEFVVGEEAQS